MDGCILFITASCDVIFTARGDRRSSTALSVVSVTFKVVSSGEENYFLILLSICKLNIWDSQFILTVKVSVDYLK